MIKKPALTFGAMLLGREDEDKKKCENCVGCTAAATTARKSLAAGDISSSSFSTAR